MRFAQQLCGAQVLCIQGFLAARKHAEQILLLAEMMQARLLPLGNSAHAGTVPVV